MVAVSKTEAMVGAIAQYLRCTEMVPLSQRVAEVERKVSDRTKLIAQMESWTSLLKYLKKVLDNLGQEYAINFV
jgi:hypothetical protein